MGGRRDGRVRLRGGEGIWKMDGLLLSIRETESEGRDGGKREERVCEVWERRWLSCLFEDKSERQCSEEVYIQKHTRKQMCVRALTLELTHMQTHTRTQIHSLTQLAHTLPHGEVVKGHG